LGRSHWLAIGVNGSHLSGIWVDIPLSTVIIEAVAIWRRLVVGLDIGSIVTGITPHGLILSIKLGHNRHSPR
jgi:hypothetical protein